MKTIIVIISSIITIASIAIILLDRRFHFDKLYNVALIAGAMSTVIGGTAAVQDILAIMA